MVQGFIYFHVCRESETYNLSRRCKQLEARMGVDMETRSGNCHDKQEMCEHSPKKLNGSVCSHRPDKGGTLHV